MIAFFDNLEMPSPVDKIPFYLGEQGFDRWRGDFGSVTAVNGVVAIGRCGPDRMHVLNRFESCGMMTPMLIHPRACVSPSSVVGRGSQILAFALLGADVIIGDACIINHRAVIDHECILEEGVHVAPGATLCGAVRVGRNVFVGAGAIILPRLHVGASSTIGAGAVVTHDVPPGVIVVGNPARIY